MNCLVQKQEVTGSERYSCDDDSNEESDFYRQFQVRRENSETVISEDSEMLMLSDMDSDEESDFYSRINNKQGRRKSLLMLNEGDSEWNLSLPSWANGMSLIDRMTPRRAEAMAHVNFPGTPPVIPTPQEFQEINLKKLKFDKNSNRFLCYCSGGSNQRLGSRRSPVSNALSEVVIAELREEKET